jgi:hypothetical protein
MRLNALTIDPVITDKLHFDFDILNGTGSNFNTITQVMNVTNATSWIILNSSSSFAHSVVNHTGLSSSLFSPNVSGQTFAMRFSTNNGSSWTGTMYFTSPLILDYPI